MIQFTRRASLSPRPMTRQTGLWQTINEIVAWIAVWKHRAKSRAELAKLPPERLRDIGVTLDEAATEASKPFWR